MSAVLVAQERWAEAEVNLQAAVSASLPRLAWSKALAHTQLQLAHALRHDGDSQRPFSRLQLFCIYLTSWRWVQESWIRRWRSTKPRRKTTYAWPLLSTISASSSTPR